MAKSNIQAWQPVAVDTQVTVGQAQPSAIMTAAGAPRNLNGASALEVPRLIGASVGVGCDLTEGGNGGDTATMYSSIFNGKETLCEADIYAAATGNQDVFAAFDKNWLDEMHVRFDNAAIGVSGARSGTETDLRPFTSIYRSVRTADADVDYVADANYATGPLTYDSGSAVLAKLEAGRFGNVANTVILAHPGLKAALRDMKDANDRPIWLNNGRVEDEQLFGYRVLWTQGAVVSTNMGMTSTTNKLLVAVNTQYLAWGRGNAVTGAPAGPVSRVIPSSVNVNSLATTLVYATREGFVLTVPQAASVLEVVNA